MSSTALQTREVGLLIQRIVVGAIFAAHGWPKLADGAAGTTAFFGQLGVPLPGASAWLITILEFFGGLALIAGAMVGILSILLIVHMLTGIFLVHLPQGFYVIGPGQGGMELNLLLIAALLTLILAGPGRPAVDARLRGGEAEPPGTAGT